MGDVVTVLTRQSQRVLGLTFDIFVVYYRLRIEPALMMSRALAGMSGPGTKLQSQDRGHLWKLFPFV